jgi:Mg-chelatase subunit ChlD
MRYDYDYDYGYSDGYGYRQANPWEFHSQSFRSRPPTHYIPPSLGDISRVAKEVGLTHYDPSLIADFCNLEAGGDLESIDEVRKISRGIGADPYRPIPLSMGVDKYVDNQAETTRFLRDFDRSKLPPGETPLHRAAMLASLLYNQEGGKPGSGGLLFNNKSAEHKLKEINDILEAAANLTDAEKLLLTDNGTSKSAQTMQILRDLKNKVINQESLRIARNLNTLTRMNVRLTREVTPDPNGSERRMRRVEGPNDLTRMVPQEWAFDLTHVVRRTLAREPYLREKVSVTDKKQLLFMILDCSGSMTSGQRMAKAIGIALNRIKAVVQGLAEMYFSYFESHLVGETLFANDLDSARTMLKYIQENSRSGGGTAIVHSATQAFEKIEAISKEGRLVKPELAIVTDGEDRVEKFWDSDFKGLKVHAFVVECENPALVQYAVSTGGVGVNHL